MGFRVPSEMFLNQYISDEPYRAMAGNLSETGVLLNRVKATGALQENQRVIGLEFELPGTGETIWARGEAARGEALGPQHRQPREAQRRKCCEPRASDPCRPTQGDGRGQSS